VTTRRVPAKPKPKKRQTGGKSALLEQCVQSLGLLGFHEHPSYRDFQRAEVINPRHVIRNYPHDSLYGTPGRKEAFISAPDGAGCFILDDEGIARIILEAKWQGRSGSTDEKLPLVWEAFLASPIRNWIVVLDGPFWNTNRGKAAAAWLQGRAPGPDGRQLYVVDRRGFLELARRAWGREL
jgi:hypothetical protein